ncbi:MAG: 3-oxo-tetronate kinase [Burkholderiales bacterium]
MELGCIADDLTGATDLGVNLAREGRSVVQVNGVPGAGMQLPAADVVIVALKSRTLPADEAVAVSMRAHAFLSLHGARRFYFKYCSTFDSTARGNIGPVTEALQRATGAGCTPATPAYPRNGRTVYCGNLFVQGTPLAETGMRHHPLTPMTDSNLVRVLGSQSRGKVGLVDIATLDRGVAAVRARLAALEQDGFAHAIVDAIDDRHIEIAGSAFAGLALTTGGAGLAVGIVRALPRHASAVVAYARPATKTRAAWLAGSVSEATQKQVAEAKDAVASWRLDPRELARDAGTADRIAALAVAASREGPVLVYATASAAEVKAAQDDLGAARSAELVENAFRGIARALAADGVRAFVVAGGETSGAVVEALDAKALAIGPEIAPGVPWTKSVAGSELWLALKSGNFGGEGFFRRAMELL